MATAALMEEHNARRIIIRGMLTDIAEVDKLLADVELRREVAGMFMSNARDYLSLRIDSTAAAALQSPPDCAAPLDDATAAAAAAAAAPLDAAMTVAIEAAMMAAAETAADGIEEMKKQLEIFIRVLNSFPKRYTPLH